MSSAFIYKVQDYKESSKLLFTYSAFGKITLIAKGAKNYKNAYHSITDYFTLIDCELVNNKQMQTLKGASLLNDYANYKTLANSSLVKGYINAINYLITDDLPHERLFTMFLLLLDFSNIKLAIITFYIKLTYALGYELTFYKNDYLGFNLKLGKSVSIFDKISIDLNKEETDLLKELYFLKEEKEVDSKLLGKLEQFIKEYYKYHMDYKIEV